jgi:hypothetical protein
LQQVTLLVQGSDAEVQELEHALRAADVGVVRTGRPRRRGAGEIAEMVMVELLATGAVEAVRAVVAAYRRRHGVGSVETGGPDDSPSSDPPE